MTDTDVMRELCAMELDAEPPVDPDQATMMTDDEFDAEVALAAEGKWEELGLDALPDGWKPVTIDDLRASE